MFLKRQMSFLDFYVFAIFLLLLCVIQIKLNIYNTVSLIQDFLPKS